jgi:hypothetical protein
MNGSEKDRPISSRKMGPPLGRAAHPADPSFARRPCFRGRSDREQKLGDGNFETTSTDPDEMDILKRKAEVDRALVALLDFKSSVPSEQGGRWVRFPCTSANFFALLRRA